MFPRQANALSARAEGVLDTCRRAVLQAHGRRARAAVARAKFGAKTAKVSWREIRNKLARAKPAGSTCQYCEMDRYRDIDHVYPLAVYPEDAFDYQNYIFSCVICNQNRKREQCGIVTPDGVIPVGEYCRVDMPLPHGARALINPRTEDPRSFFYLDIDTGLLLLRDGLSNESRMRAQYTRDILVLNDPNLARDRRSMAVLYIQLMVQIANAINRNDNESFGRLFDDFYQVDRPTVLAALIEHVGEHDQFREALRVFTTDTGLDLAELLT